MVGALGIDNRLQHITTIQYEGMLSGRSPVVPQRQIIASRKVGFRMLL